MTPASNRTLLAVQVGTLGVKDAAFFLGSKLVNDKKMCSDCCEMFSDFSGHHQCCNCLSVPCRCWLGDRRSICPVETPVPVTLRVLSWNDSWLVGLKERKSIYIAPFRTKVHTKHSGMDHTVLPANNTMPAFPWLRLKVAVLVLAVSIDIKKCYWVDFGRPSKYKTLHDDAFFNMAPHTTPEHGLSIFTGGKIEKLCSPVNTDCQHRPCSSVLVHNTVFTAHIHR